MTKDKHTDKNPKLDILVKRYQETKAPLGFVDRVAAHIEDERTQHSAFSWVSSSWIENITSLVAPKVLYAASFGIVVLISVLIVPSIMEIEPELQIAQHDNPEPQSTPRKEDAQDNSSHNEKVQIAATNTTNSTDNPVTGSTTVIKNVSKEEIERFFAQPKSQTGEESYTASLAVLTDISEWLTDENGEVAPDIGDLPDLNDIDAIFDTT
jgi:hypothetical protein